MNKELSSFAARLRALISHETPALDDRRFNELALELFSLQFAHNAAYRKICEARRLTPQIVEHWTQIPSVPTSAFKEWELTSIAPGERTAVFHSSGTTEQKPSRHFHNAESLDLYTASLWSGFERNVLDNSKSKVQNSKLICLTPPPEAVPHSSLVHMLETVRQRLGAPKSVFVGKLDAEGLWTLDFEAFSMNIAGKGRGEPGLSLTQPPLTLALSPGEREQREDVSHRLDAGKNSAGSWSQGRGKIERRLPGPEIPDPRPHLILGTAFSFVHLLDSLAEKNLRLQLPENSRVMETGGYKNRSRSMSRAELHLLITKYLGVPAQDIICEYGMSELSSQAYDGNPDEPDFGARVCDPQRFETERSAAAHRAALRSRLFRFPPWARVQIVSPETGREVIEGETGLIRIFDLANAFSVSAIQTEDLGIRRGDGFELVGRAKLAEPRGCSLAAA
ncbi:MAG TPA: hypothetical protein VGI03_02585 [Verrucomicrobiae bacterium]|jgi:hypothetical protein